MAADGNGGGNPNELAVPSTVARLNYFYGQLLSQADLKAEQQYHVLLRRLLQRETFGTGTVAGLKVDAAGAPNDRAVFVRPGLAMDPDGRELLVTGDTCVTIAAPALTPGAAGITGTDAGSIADSLRTVWDESIDAKDVGDLQDALQTALLTEAGPEFSKLLAQLNKVPVSSPLPPGVSLADFLFDALVATTYLGLRYQERGADPGPSILDATCCATPCQPTRLQEGVCVVTQSSIFAAVPDPWADAHLALLGCFIADENGSAPPSVPFAHGCRRCLADYLLGAWRPLPGTTDACGSVLPVVPLARIYWSRYAREPIGAVRVLAIENIAFRPLAPGGAVTRALLDVVTQCAPAIPIPPVVVSVDPPNRTRAVLTTKPLVLVAHADGLLVANPLETTPNANTHWEIDFYANDGVATARWHDAGGDPHPGIQIDMTIVGQDVSLILSDGSGGPPPLEAGTYHWRVNLQVPVTGGGEGWHIVASHTHAALDGEPNPSTTVPSGDGVAGGQFEASFYITNG